MLHGFTVFEKMIVVNHFCDVTSKSSNPARLIMAEPDSSLWSVAVSIVAVVVVVVATVPPVDGA